MSSISDLIDHFKLDTQFYDNYTQHIFRQSDSARGQRRVKVKKRWYRRDKIGQGGFGTVWREEEQAGEVRAVKEIPRQGPLQSRIDYQKELLAMAKLSKYHDLFVCFKGWYENTNSIFLAMEYFSLGDLYQHLSTELSESDVRTITKQILEGLDQMHEHGFTHRDLKPQNIFVVSKEPSWWVKIGDFGITKRIESAQTALRTVIGTQYFQAPEILGYIEDSEESSEYTSAVDIWSLGCVTFQLLTRKVPFQDFRSIRLYSQKKTPFPIVDLEKGSISDKGIGFIKDLMVPDPSKRLTAKLALQAAWLEGTEDLPKESSQQNKDLADDESVSFEIPQPAVNDDAKTERSSRAPQASASKMPTTSTQLKSVRRKLEALTGSQRLDCPDPTLPERKFAIGIDLGTTNTRIGIFREDCFEIIPDEQGNHATPSMVAFTSGQSFIGVAAKSQMHKNPRNTVTNAKSFIPCSFEASEKFNRSGYGGVKGSTYIWKGYDNYSHVAHTVEVILSMIFMKAKKNAESYLGGSVELASITVPSSFTGSQRQAIRDASIAAGLLNHRLIDDSSAAAFAYARATSRVFKECRTVLVFVLGGGSCNVSVVELTETYLLKVLSKAGDNRLGGEDFTTCLLDHFVAEFRRTHAKDLTTDPRALSRLRSACEQCKRTLSSAVQCAIELESVFEGLDLCTSITRVQFEELCQNKFNLILRPVEEALKRARRHISSIDEVILVGGSTRIPRIQRIMSDFFGSEKIRKSVNPDEAVIDGAAMMASILFGDPSLEYLLLNLSSFAISISADEGSKFCVLRSTDTIPSKRSITVDTTTDNQESMMIHVYETQPSNLLPKHEHLRTLYLNGLPKVPKGACYVEITIDMDANQNFSVIAHEKSSGHMTSVFIDDFKANSRTKNEMQSMQLTLQRYMVEDDERDAYTYARNALESFAYSLKELLTDAETEKVLTQAERAYIRKTCDDVTEMISETTSREVIEQTHKSIKDVVRNIMARLALASS